MHTKEDNGEVPMNAKALAESLAVWAKEKNLFSASGAEDGVDTDEAESVVGFTPSFTAQAVEEILRKRAINLIAFNEPQKKVIVFTHGKLSKGDLEKLPFHSNGYSYDYVQGGVAQVKGLVPPGHARTHTVRGNAYTCGSSVFPAHCAGAGTLGLLVQDQAGQMYGLSNNHVTGACNSAMPGIPILAPGPIDSNEHSCDPFTIGRHSRLLPINDGIPENIAIDDNLDAAIFQITDPARVSSMQGNILDTPSDVHEPVPGWRVEKVGRTTGHTRGLIVGQAVTPQPVRYSINEYGISKTVYFNNVFIVAGDNGQPFSRRGDSGSLVVATDPSGNRYSAGLVFAGDEQRNLSFILALGPTMQKLGVTIVSGHNV